MAQRKVRWVVRPIAPPRRRSPAGVGPRPRRPRGPSRPWPPTAWLRRGPWAGDAGAATAEIAVALPVLVLLTFVGMGAVNAVLTKVRCVDAARDAALAAARGEAGVPAGQRFAPAGATVEVSVDGDLVRARVRATVRPLGGLGAFDVTAEATAAVEPGAGGASP